ncbi:MAG: DUF362 domain-containing protein [Thermodesulfobacteriota bacterium]|nr:DUF362 domain-containing protein [Thermodesulfobacteriota bacterium]
MQTVLIEPTTYDTVEKAVDTVFERFPQHLAGKRVLIKPNVLRTAKPEEAVVTHPAVLRAVVQRVAAEKPAEIVVGDNPGLFNYGAIEEAFEKSGLMEAAMGYYRNIGIDSVKMDFNPDFMASVSLSKSALDAEVIISLPKFKTHGLTVITGAIKNSYGLLPGAQKAKLHQAAGSPERFHEVIVDVFKLRIPDLFIGDAVLGMEGNGPASPDTREIGKILASDNAVALDAVIAQMMGIDPARLRFFGKAKADGLGDYDPASINIIGPVEPIPNFKLPPLSGKANINNPALQDMMQQKSRLIPRVSDDCTACGTCVEQCPVNALSMDDNGFPHADADTCITCFCCQELCPEKAIMLG